MFLIAQADSVTHWITYVYPYLPLIGTLIAALIAMRHWKYQQYLRQRHDLAFKMIHSAIKFREEFWRARQPLMTGGEIDVFKRKYDITEEQVETKEIHFNESACLEDYGNYRVSLSI